MTREEPPIGTVLAYQRKGTSGVMLSYVSMRAGNGLWYTPGAAAAQGVDWAKLTTALSNPAVGPVRYATGWAEL